MKKDQVTRIEDDVTALKKDVKALTKQLEKHIKFIECTYKPLTSAIDKFRKIFK
jgi:hypothetical protein